MSDFDPYPPEATRPVQVSPAGWYPLDGELRYWDGHVWTEHRQPSAPQPAYAVGPSYGLAATANPTYPTYLTDARPKPVETVFAWVLTVLTLLYFLPWAVAATRGKSNSWAVGLVNLLVGWTLIGWIVALVMACTAHQVVAVRG